MKPIYFIAGSLYFVYILTLQAVEGQNDTSATVFNSSQSYCFRFTWLGPEFDDTTTLANTTCSEYMDSKRAEGLPCRQPLAVTYDGTPPDIDFLYNNESYRDRVICRRARGQVCAKYSFSFNGALQNITYMCARAYVVDEGPVTKGCYEQQEGGYAVEVCICESIPGARPCNDAPTFQISTTLLGAILIFFFNYR